MSQFMGTAAGFCKGSGRQRRRKGAGIAGLLSHEYFSLAVSNALKHDLVKSRRAEKILRKRPDCGIIFHDDAIRREKLYGKAGLTFVAGCAV